VGTGRDRVGPIIIAGYQYVPQLADLEHEQ